VTAYAEAKDCLEAILIYPEGFYTNLSGKVDRINIRNVVFSLDGDLKKAGNRFVENLFGMRIDEKFS
jgi:5-methylcytosine-specific restriction enzyme subunit McrC